MNKGDLVAEVSAVSNNSKRVTSEVIDALFDTIARAVASGEHVAISGFGTFEKRLRAPRTARNPQTGDEVKVPATSVPVFRPGQQFKDAVANKRRRRR